MNNTRAVITGIGALCSIGNNISEISTALKTGKRGLKRIPDDRFNTDHAVYKTQSGCTIDHKMFLKIIKEDITVLGKAAMIAIEEALTDAGMYHCKYSKGKSIGISLATSIGTSYSYIQYIKKVIDNRGEGHYDLLHNTAPTIAGSIAKQLFLNGPITTISTACASGTNSIGRAYDYIKNNRADVMIAGGVDLFTELTFSGFNSLQALSVSSCRPFDTQRDGLNLGDAAAFLILESYESALKRNAQIYAEIIGYSILNEAYHPTAPSPEGEFALRAMKEALAEAGISAADVDYINAHGTGTPANDIMEIKAIKKLLTNVDKTVYYSSTKSMTGHTLGAAGAIEIIATVIGMAESFVPPSVNVADEIASVDNLILAEKPIALNINYALSNSFGFAGNMASIALKRLSKKLQKI